MTEPTNGELALMIGNLTKNVEEGFRGTHARQDEANHEISKSRDFRLKNEDFINDLKKERENTIRRYSNLIWNCIITAVLIFLGVTNKFK